MPNPVWPSSLPANPFGSNDPNYTPQENIIRSSMDVGAAKVRRRSTAIVETLAVTLQLSDSQRRTLRAFLVNTLGMVGRFDWVDFRTGQLATYRLADKALPTEKYLGINEVDGQKYWDVSFSLELLP